jgi:hypothetical protein
MRRAGWHARDVPKADIAPAMLGLCDPREFWLKNRQEMSLLGFLQLPVRAQLVHDGWKMLCKSPKYLVDWQTE